MKIKDIGLYTTYAGDDGTERRVVGFGGKEKAESIQWMTRKTPRLVFVTPAKEFARWAKKEVKP